MMDYFACISCDTGFFEPLNGKYSILKYTLEPCKITERNQHRGVANFVVSFPFQGYPEKGLTEQEHLENNFRNMQLAIEEAKLFISWLSVATRKPLDLSNIRFGGMQSFGPCTHEPINEVDRSKVLKIHHIKEDAVEGTYEKVKRPIYDSYINSGHSLKIPHDFSRLTKKLYALSDEHREMFFDSCLSYQFALINSSIIPSVSLVALVNVVESLTRNEDSSGYCEKLGELCPNKRDVMKKFRAFFESHLQYPLPDEMRRFLNDVYKNRSNFVHKALLGSGPFRGPIYMGLGGGRELDDQLSKFKVLVNASIIDWLIRI